MNIFLISYGLQKPVKDYPDLYDAIKKIGDWAHALDSVWFVYTDMNLSQVNSAISKVVDSNDNYFVMPITGVAVGRLPKTIWDWLNPKQDL